MKETITAKFTRTFQNAVYGKMSTTDTIVNETEYETAPDRVIPKFECSVNVGGEDSTNLEITCENLVGYDDDDDTRAFINRVFERGGSIYELEICYNHAKKEVVSAHIAKWHYIGDYMDDEPYDNMYVIL